MQFAVNPRDGRLIVIEMNPRVSRSSALASKATGFPIAKIAAKLAVGYTLDELDNDITKITKACFEPTIDYCVVKFPRWAFEKFPTADPVLTTQMKSVGECMAIGGTFKEAMQKALRGLETGRNGYGNVPGEPHCRPEEFDKSSRSAPTSRRRAPTASTGCAAPCSSACPSRRCSTTRASTRGSSTSSRHWSPTSSASSRPRRPVWQASTPT